MSVPEFHLAQVNIARARGEMTDPVMADFAAALPAINALAEGTPASSGGSRPRTETPPRSGPTRTTGS